MKHLLSFLLCAPLLACGGIVVLEDDGAGGASSSSAKAGSTVQSGSSVQSGSTAQSAVTVVSGSTTTGDSCAILESALLASIEAALYCSPLDPNVQCDGTVMIPDLCGCPIVANEDNPGEVEAARAAFDAWVAAGCGPYLCEGCFEFFGGYCAPRGNGNAGRCEGYLPG